MLPSPPRRRSPTAVRRATQGEGGRTVLIALLANLVIFVAKLIAGLASGSTGMLAEAAHSAADSVNEVLLAISLRRDRGPADAAHPLGHGRERFLWAFMAAIASFLIGGCLSIGMAVRALEQRGGAVPSSRLAWMVLAVSLAADGVSWAQGFRQARRQAKEYGLGVWHYLRHSSDPVVRAVVVEDSAALVGLCLAGGGLFLSRVAGNNVPDSLASLCIGILLAVTAFGLARPLADFLVGRSLPHDQLEKLHAIVKAVPVIDEVLALHAVYSGPEEVIVVAKVRPSAKASADELARAMDALEGTIRSAIPVVADIYVDVTRRSAKERAAPGG
jgi:cation diffusion facilitator family transporter